MKTIFNIFFIFLFSTMPLFAENHSLCEGKQIWGNVEKVVLTDKNLVIDAKLDTGAAMSSLTAKNIELFKQNNIDWVRFTVYLSNGLKKATFSEPLVGTTRILKRSDESDNSNKKFSTRYVIKMPIRIGHQQKEIFINLVDRSQFRYPMLLGKDALQQFHVLVDVSQTYRVSEKMP